MKVAVDLVPSADFMTCLFPALIAAVPAFLESFMTCLTGGASTPGYKPGDRKRCG